jgi:hypothetical protein
MRRLLVLTISLLVLLPPGQALAHGLGQSQNLPLPPWLYLFAGATVVLVSFVQIGLFLDVRHALSQYPRLNLLRIEPLRAVLTNKSFLLGLRLLSVALFLLVIFSGLLGRQGPSSNFAPTFVWITWWVGFGYFTAFVGNLWPLVNPWKIIFEWADRLARRLGAEKGLELGEPYPASFGVWPALALFACFVWVENVFEGSATPINIALFAILYSMLTWSGMVIFGKEVWLRSGEAFSVFFSILAKFAPTEVRVTDPKLCRDCGVACQLSGRGCVNCYECFAKAAPEDRELNLRPWAVGLSLAERVTLDRLAFVVFMLASVTYDSLLGTPPLVELQRLTSMPSTLGLVVLPVVFLAVYLGFVKLSQVFGFGYVPLRRLATAYVYSLVPIALAYQVAHYYTLLLIQGQAIITLVSDPFGWGWNLFGTADYEVNAGIIGADFVWYSQIALMVAGHVIAIYIAHVAALRLLRDPKLAMRSQYPIVALMILYTIFSLWILSQPIVETRNETRYEVAAEDVSAPAPTETAPQFDPTLREPPIPTPPASNVQ